MKKNIILLLCYIISTSALSLMVFTRKKIGQDVFLPWQVRPANALIRFFLRYIVICLLFIWIRIFLLFEVAHSSTSPFDTSKGFIHIFFDFKFYKVFSVQMFFYYLSMLAVLAGFTHMIAFEVYYRMREPVSSGSLGKCFFSTWMKGRVIFNCVIDSYLVWGFIEPMIILTFGFLLKFVTASNVLFIFFTLSSIAMFFHGQFARLKHRMTGQGIIDSKSDVETIRPIASSFGKTEKKEPKNILDNTSEATIA